MISANWKDKIHFIKDGLSREFLNDIIQAFEMHPSGDVYHILLDLMKLFNKEKECYNLENLMLKDYVC